MDFIFRHANLPDGRSNIDIGILADRIIAVERGLAATGATEVDALGRLLSPPFLPEPFPLLVRSSLVFPPNIRLAPLLEGIYFWAYLIPNFTTSPALTLRVVF